MKQTKKMKTLSMKTLLLKAIKLQQSQEQKREEAFLLARSILKNSKKAISRLHFEDQKEARKLLEESGKNINYLKKILPGNSKLRNEGFVREALEEFTEAALFFDFENENEEKNKVSFASNSLILLEDYPDALIGGLCDFTGEIARKAVRIAQKGKEKEVERGSGAANTIIDGLLELNLSGYLRSKFDQAKHNAQRLEMILYELRIRDQ